VLGGIGSSILAIRFHQRSDLLAASPLGPATHAVVFVVDGMRPSDLFAGQLPHILDLQRHGVTYSDAWVGQLQDVGPASNATIATGALPRRHGVIGLVWTNPQTGQLERPTNAQQVQLGSLDQVMQAANTMPLAGLIKHRYPGARALSVGGTCADADAGGSWLADYVLCPVRRRNHWQPGFVTGHRLPGSVPLPPSLTVTIPRGHKGRPARPWRTGAEDGWVARYAVAAMRHTHPLLTVINFPELAGLSSTLSAGQRNSSARVLMAGIDHDVWQVLLELRREGVANRTVFVLTSDQGSVDVSTRLPMQALRRGVTAAGGQSTYQDGGELATVGLQDVLQAQPVAQAIQDEHLRGVDGIYYKARTGSSWVYQAQYVDPDLPAAFNSASQAELVTMASPVSPDVVVACAPGTAFLPANAQARSVAGLGLQWDAQHIPLVIAGHGVVAGVQSVYPARLADVMPTLAGLMWLSAPHTDGVALADGMAQPSDAARSAQRQATARMQRIVRALRQRSRLAGL
jgi:arylsulfatase A-like enzyme